MTSALAARAFAAAWSQAMMTDSGAFDRAAHYLAQEWGQVPADRPRDAGDGPARARRDEPRELRAGQRAQPLAAVAPRRRARRAGPGPRRARPRQPRQRAARHPLDPRQDRSPSSRARSGGSTGRATASAGTAAGPRRPPWRPWPMPGSARRRRSWPGPSSGCSPTAPATAGSRPRRGGRPSRPWPSTSARPSRPRTAIGWSSTVNDAEVYNAEIAGAADGKGVLVPRKALKLGDRNRVRFHVEGRATFGYAVALTGFARDFGPEQKRDGQAVHRRPPRLPRGRARAGRQDAADRLRLRRQPAATSPTRSRRSASAAGPGSRSARPSSTIQNRPDVGPRLPRDRGDAAGRARR